MGRYGCQICAIPHPVSLIWTIWYNKPLYCLQIVHNIFFQKSLDCFPSTAKTWKITRIGLLGLVNPEIPRIYRNSTIVSEFLIFPMHIMLISLQKYIYKLTFHFFHFKIGLTSSTFIKDQIIPPANKRKWLYVQDSRATSNPRVPCTMGTTCASI
jgi:hypothetical protein